MIATCRLMNAIFNVFSWRKNLSPSNTCYLKFKPLSVNVILDVKRNIWMAYGGIYQNCTQNCISGFWLKLEAKEIALVLNHK